MKQYKLIKKYPSLPKDWKVNMIVGQGDRGGYSDFSPCNGKYSNRYIRYSDVENYPEFWEEVREPLFTTIDEVNIYGGEPIYAVSDDFQLLYCSFAQEKDKTLRSFAEKENAKRYILESKKLYTLADMVRIANHFAYIKSVTPEVTQKVIDKWTNS